MKLKYLLAVALTATLGVGSVAARTWTSADGKKTFEGELKAFDKAGGQVTVILRNGRSLTFGIDKLSEGDRTFLDENGKPAGGGEGAAGDVAGALKAQKLGSKLGKKGILEKLDGKRFARHELTKAPEYYILYFSASW